MKLYSVLAVLGILVTNHVQHVVSGKSESHPCQRGCLPDQGPMVCEYFFTLEWYLTLSKACFDCPFNLTDCDRPHCIPADGKRKATLTINRQFPAPTIEVCEGDTIVVHVNNHLENGEGVTIHWHGQHVLGNPYMDGTGMVTQCPITMRSTFTYEFEANPSGTSFYHSHIGLQRGDGLLGALIVHSASSNKHELYDHDCLDRPTGECDFIVIVNDWPPEPGVSRFMYHMAYSFNRTLPLSSLINGRNRKYDVRNGTNPKQVAKTPWYVFQVEKGKRYRFRVINAGSMLCPFKISVDGHRLTVIAADGSDVVARDIDVFAIYPGERYDFVLHAKEEIDNYWFKAHALVDCSPASAHAYAIVRYNGASTDDPIANPGEDRRGYFLNPVQSDASEPENQHGYPYDILADDLDNVAEEDFTDEVVDVTYYVGMDYYANDNARFGHSEFYPIQNLTRLTRHFTPVLNNITFFIPPVPVLSQPEDFNMSWACNDSTVNQEHCYENGCVCTHLISFDLGQVVELVLVNEGVTFNEGGHSLHLHGYKFRVLGLEKLGTSTSRAEVMRLNKKGDLKKKLINPSYRDTINVPDGGYVITRFIADNPGYWFLHCHVEGHMEQGQALLIKVGSPSDWPPPPEGFPRCGNWAPKSSATAKSYKSSVADAQVTISCTIFWITCYQLIILFLS